MSEPPLIYAFHGEVLLNSPNLFVFGELYLPVSRSKNLRTKCQNVLKSCLYNVQAVIFTLGTLIKKPRSKIFKIAFSLIVVISDKDSDSFLLESLETQTCVTAAQNCCCFHHIFLWCYILIKLIFSVSLFILTSLSEAFITLLTPLVELCYYRLALSAISALSPWNDHRPRLTLPLLLL